MSVTAASADEWLPIRPGSEPQFVMAMMRMLLDGQGARHADALPAKTRASVEAADLAGLIRATGIEEKRLRQVARELGESEGALVLAGASTVHANSLDGLVAAHYLNVMIGAPVKLGAAMPVAQGSVEACVARCASGFARHRGKSCLHAGSGAASHGFCCQFWKLRRRFHRLCGCDSARSPLTRMGGGGSVAGNSVGRPWESSLCGHSTTRAL